MTRNLCILCLSGFLASMPSVSASEHIPASTIADEQPANSFSLSNKLFSGKTTLSLEMAPTGMATRTYPRLVNYHHMSMPDGRIDHKEQRLAQWDIIILNPDLVRLEKLSLHTIRQTNRRIKILAWIPLGQEPVGVALARGIPREGVNDWFCHYPDGKYIRPAWGGHFMNPDACTNAWPKHVADFVSRHYLQTHDYDGVLLDIMAERNWMGADLNQDGRCDTLDETLWQKGINLAVSLLRTNFPQAIITGNGGSPWSEQCPYFAQANGDMHENALGNQFGIPGWDNLWEGYQTCIKQVKTMPPIHFISVDLRNDRSLQEAQTLTSLTPDDLRRMRLGLCTALLDDGYFGFDRGDCLHGQLWWFDEYDVDLGNPISKYQRDRYASGAYSREFQNGVVVVNPSKKPVTIELKESLMDATTHQATQVFVIPAQDAKILLRFSDR